MGILLAVFALSYDIYNRRIDLHIAEEDRRQARIVSAWQLLTTKAPGNSGKAEALEYLNKLNVPLIGIDLSTESGTGVYVGSLKLPGAYLYGTNFSAAFMQGADLHRSDLTEVIFRDADLMDADLSMAQMQNANFENAMMWRTDLNGAIIINTDLSSAKLQLANMSGVNLFSSNLDNANLSGANLENADLSHVSLNGTNLESANLQGANLSDVDLTKAKVGEYIDMSEIDIISFLEKSSIKVNAVGEARIRSFLFDEGELSDDELRLIVEDSGLPIVDSDLLHRMDGDHLKSLGLDAILFSMKPNAKKILAALLSRHKFVHMRSLIGNTNFSGACGNKKTKMPEGYSILKPC